MNLTKRLAISYYKTIAVINESHKIYFVQHQETKKIYVKKILDVYNLSIYEYLYHHPILGIPKIIEFYEENHQLTLIEEYISGCSLLEKMQSASLTLPDIVDYMIDLCNILEQLHNLHPPIIHRDIKPSNIIITEYNRVVLLDFNAAKHFHAAESQDTVLLGTQGYAAPEQYGFGSSSPQTDIYSLGILLKEMLSTLSLSSHPYHSIVNRCTQMDPKKRYQTVSDLKKAFESPHDEKEKLSIPKNRWTKFTPPGYRSRTPWKMILASFVYFIIFYCSFTLEMPNTYGGALWLERICSLFIPLSIIAGCYNYLGIQRFMPLCSHSNRIIRYLGITILDFGFSFFLLLLFTAIESICFH